MTSNSDNNDNTNDDKPLCPICCDTLSPSQISRRKCCKQIICHSCLHEHISSILTEGILGDGRTDLTCPLGCGRDLTDSEIRSSIKKAHHSIPHHIIGPFFLGVLYHLGFFFCQQYCHPHVICPPYGRRRRRPRHDANDAYYDYFLQLTTSPSERTELERYNRWSLTVAISQRDETHRTAEDVIYCPSPDCGYLWMASGPYRRRKQDNEPRAVPRRGSLADRAIAAFSQAASTMLFYKSLDAAEEMTVDVRSGGGADWCPPEGVTRDDDYRRLLLSSNNATANDGRRCFCPRCRAEFCGLCRRPWVILSRRGATGGLLATKPKRHSHKGKACVSYASMVGNRGGEDYGFAAHALNAKVCPGCSILTQRISGCNHMTCSCGTEWCYVCEVRWNVGHYACVDRGVVLDEGRFGCVVS